MDILGYKYLIGDKGLVFDVKGAEPITEVVEGTQFKVEKDSVCVHIAEENIELLNLLFDWKDEQLFNNSDFFKAPFM